MITATFVYFIGLVAFGPFPSLNDCMQARSQHIAHWYPGRAVTAHVTMCRPLSPFIELTPTDPNALGAYADPNALGEGQ